MVDIDKLKLILNLVREHELSELEVEQEGLRIKIRTATAHALPAPVSTSAAPAAAPLPVAPTDHSIEAAAEPEVDLAVIESPIVGTFYRSPEPGAAPFVEVGSPVKKGQVLCIIEAMKLMNEIDSEYEGEIVSVYVESGQPVQYGERLFAIKTA